MKKKNLIASIIAVVVLVALVVGMVLLYNAKKPQPTQGSKKVTVIVTDADAKETTFTFGTDAEYLEQALNEQKLIEGTVGDWGFYVTTVNGYLASDEKHEYWALYINGEYAMTGVSSTPVNDGDVYKLALETY